MTYFLDLRVQSVGGSPVGDINAINIFEAGPEGESYVSLNDLIENILGREVLLATHGFNVDKQDGVQSLSLWESRLSLGNNALYIGVLWPGDSAWIPVLDYPFEMNEAISSGNLLAEFLNANFAEAASLTFVSHSLGARMVLQTISHLNAKPQVKNLCLMAGAIVNDCLIDEYHVAARKVESLSVLASHGDWVLEFAFPTGNLLGGIITHGHPHCRVALGRDGPSSRGDLHWHAGGWQIPKEWGYGHGDYLSKAAGSPMTPPVDLPTTLDKEPVDTSAWSASFVSTRLA